MLCYVIVVRGPVLKLDTHAGQLGLLSFATTVCVYVIWSSVGTTIREQLHFGPHSLSEFQAEKCDFSVVQ
jgi:hypothetical protein